MSKGLDKFIDWQENFNNLVLEFDTLLPPDLHETSFTGSGGNFKEYLWVKDSNAVRFTIMDDCTGYLDLTDGNKQFIEGVGIDLLKVPKTKLKKVIKDIKKFLKEGLTK